MTNPHRLNIFAGVLFFIDAGYTYWHSAADWGRALMWAGIGAAYVLFGLRKRAPKGAAPAPEKP